VAEASPVGLVLTCAGEAESAAVALFPGAERRALAREELRPPVPFAGPLFELCATQPPGSCLGLVVPGIAAASGAAAGEGATPPIPAGALLAVADHVNLALSGPLTGRWPAGVPRSFPCMTGIYQPAAVRAAGSAPVYSVDVVVAGVEDVLQLTSFERRALGEAGAAAYTDRLVPAVIAAAFHGLRVAACVVLQAAHERE
jgi:hypothetical protein